jgi:hypothetical protein
MKRDQGLLGTLEVSADCQMLPDLGVLAIIYLDNQVHPYTVSKCNNIKLELTMNVIERKSSQPIRVYKELTFVKF